VEGDTENCFAGKYTWRSLDKIKLKTEKPIPPEFALRFFRWFCHPKMQDYIEGDLMEVYERRRSAKGKRHADIKFIIDVLLLFRPGIIRPTEGYRNINTYGMLKSYFKVGWRNLTGNNIYSLINIAGLSMGMTVSVLILIFVVHEFSYDKVHKNGDRIFRAEKQFSKDGRHSLYANPQFGPEIKDIDSHVINYVRLFEPGRRVVRSDNRHKFFEDRFIFSDTSYFSIFSFELNKGDRKSLARPNTVIITEEMASKYFGVEEALGKIITYDRDYAFEVVGIAKNPPSNSSLQFDFVASFGSLITMAPYRDIVLNNSSGFPTYLLLASKEDFPIVSRSILKTNYTNSSITYSLAPLFENHFNLNFGDTSNIRYVYIFLSVALLILTLALINYMNLTTAQATTRAKEVGIRKVVGARQRSLSMQFYIESAMTTVISFIVALVMINLLEPVLIRTLQIQIDTSFLRSPLFIGTVGILLVCCIFLSGSYPALVLPRFEPVAVLKGRLSSTHRSGWIKKILTTFQFAISSALIICTVIMDRQLGFLQSREIGLHREQVMAIPIDPLASNSYRAMKTEIQRQTGIAGVTTASIPLFRSNMTGVSLVQSPVSKDKVGAKWFAVDEDFFDVMGIELAETQKGRMTGNHIINETAAEAFGLGDNRLGYDLTMGDPESGIVQGKIAGVVKDFNYQSLRTRIEPLIITIVSDTVSRASSNGTLYIRLRQDSNLAEKISGIKKIYETYSSEAPFTYYFLDDAFNELQKGEVRLSKIFNIFTLVAVFIAGMGLFGMITFTAKGMAKEISIRKIFGASYQNILFLLSKEFFVLVLTGICIGSPIAWSFMRDWLNHFFYQTSMPLTIVFMAGSSVIILSIAIIWMQGARVTANNPIKNLRNE
jgi:putative ABC transport system permease protein